MSDYSESDIAIVGMAAHLPGARTIDEFWQNLVDGKESVRFFSDEELLAAGVARSLIRHPRYVPAHATTPGMEEFDGEFFGFSPKESAILDPQHRHFLECSWEALEDAGHDPAAFEGPIGVFGGCGMGSYFYFNLCSNRELVDSVGMFLLRHTGNDKDFLTTRVSHVLDLKGPSVNVQTACSTSLVAVHYAAQSLLSQECDMALAGGVTILQPHYVGYLYKEGEVLSPDGHCHAFDHRGQGTVFGSGAGVVALRRYEDAVRDGDHIYAVIRGSAINNDGASKAGYLAPSVEGQAGCIVEAQGIADVEAESIGYIECHGTGTYLGDPIEVSALTEAFRQSTDKTQFCRIGSVKTNIGHLDTAAGVASLIKAALILERETIPASLHFEEPNPAIDFESSPFVVNSEKTEWKRGGAPRRVGIQSLGVGGTNAHVILQEGPVPPKSGPATRAEQVLLLSGRSASAAKGNAQRLAAHLQEHPDQSLADVAHTLRTGRHHFERRRVVVAADHASAASYLRGEDPRRVFDHSALEDPRVALLFPGGGAQYATMGRALYEADPIVRGVIDRAARYLQSQEVGYDLVQALHAEGEDAERQLLRMELQLPAIFTVSFAMAKLLESWSIEAHAMCGHSNGEYVAATLAEVFTFEEALGLVLCRGRLMDEVEAGGMLAVPLSAEELAPHLGADVDLAAANAPQLSVASGPHSALDALEARLRERELEPRRLDINVAAHSRMFEPILPKFRAYLGTLTMRPPTRKVVSSRTGTWLTAEQATSPDYWCQHLRHTVQFSKALETLAAEGDTVFIECGPGKALGSFAKQHASIPNQAVLPTLRHKDEAIGDGRFFLEVLGRLWACGVNVPLERLQEGERRRRVRLPSYAFQRQHYFIEPGVVETKGAEIERFEDVSRFGWEPYWKPAAIEPGAGETQRWLVFMDDAGVGSRVVRSLKKAGHQVAVVWPGDTFSAKGDGEYILSPERGREGYDLLVRDLVKGARVPSRILHLWLTTVDESFRPGSSFFHRNQERGFWSLFFLAQALADENVPRPLHMTVVSNGMQAVGEETLRYPEKATALGPIKVAPRELPGLSVRALDVTLPEASRQLFGGRLAMALVDPFAGRKAMSHGLDELADIVLEEALGAVESGVAALRDGKRYAHGYRPRPLVEGEPSRRVVDGGTYLITGGLGGLGLVAAEQLARLAKVNLVLLGRSGLPPRDDWDEHIEEKGESDSLSRRMLRVRELEGLGAKVHVAAGDVTNLEQMQALREHVEAHYGPVRGVLHTAGVVADDLLQIKSLSDVEDVFAPKLHGTLILDEVFGSDEACAFFLLYSSTSTAIAPAGQVDYVAANAFLNAFARSRTRGEEPLGKPEMIAVSWGIWNQVGMAAEAFDAGDLSVGPEALPPTRRPLFDGRRRDVHGQLHLFGMHSPATHWIYDEHRVKGENPKDARGWALIPGTGYLEVAAQALDELGEQGSFEIRDLFFIRPLQIDDDSEREVRVKMRRSDEGYAMEVRSECVFEGRPAWQLHAQASLALGHVGAAPEAEDLGAIRARCERVLTSDMGIVSPQEEHLSFGPRWRVLREARYGEREALGRLHLPPAAAGDLEAGWLLHPGMMDFATGFAMELIEGYAPSHVWVPVSYESVRVHGALPKAVYSWVRSAGDNTAQGDFAYFDIDVMNEAGEPLVEIRRFAIKKLAEGVDFTVQRPPRRGEVELEAGSPGEERQLSPAEERLRRNLERGIVPSEGAEALTRVLADPAPEIIVSSLALPGLIEEAGQVAIESSGSGAKFARPELDSEYVEPRDEVERTLVGFWEDLLGVENVGVQDSFFDLGGHSLIAVRLFAMVKKAYEVEFPISVLFEAPTIEACASLVQEAIGGAASESKGTSSKSIPPQRRYTHVVAMHPASGGGERTPFWLVAGMFGNVLNLRHLAHLLGGDRPFYGLQAKGLYGGDEPHETFEEMARDYIAEMRTIQERGPYMVGGFSGGGYTALEIARQLRDAGEEVGLVVLLDTPALLVPERLTLRDRATIQMQRIEQKGPQYFVEWAQNRLEWEFGKIRKRFEEAEELSGAEFHNEAIEAAFRRALERYTIPNWDQALHLFRPPLEKAYVLAEGKILNHDREYVWEDNGWGRHCDDVRVYEVPGDHDSMVLEPNVRVLARKLRELIDDAEARARPKASASGESAAAEE